MTPVLQGNPFFFFLLIVSWRTLRNIPPLVIDYGWYRAFVFFKPANICRNPQKLYTVSTLLAAQTFVNELNCAAQIVYRMPEDIYVPAALDNSKLCKLFSEQRPVRRNHF
jgi:hypothetical protein